MKKRIRNSFLENLVSESAVLLKKGLFHIFGGSLLVKIIGFADVTLLIRILSKTEYGKWSYSLNIFQIVLLFAAFGAPAGILQFCSRSKETQEKISYWKFGLLFGLKANLFLGFLFVTLSLFVPFPIQGSNQILLALSLLPTLMIFFDSQTLFLRATFRNKSFAGVSLFSSILLFCFTVFGALTLGISGVIVGRYLAMFSSVLFSSLGLKGEWKEFWKSHPLSKTQRKAFLAFSIVAMLSNSVSSLLYKIDTFLVGTLSQSSEIVATYQTATLVPFNLNFIPIALITFAYPYFAKEAHNFAWLKKNTKKMIVRLAILNATISTLLFLLAPMIIQVLFGAQYLDSLIPFRILSLGYFFAGTFRIPLGNVIAALGKIKVNLWLSIAMGISNIVLDYWFIQLWGAIGAAFATLSVFILSSLGSISYFWIFLKKSKG